MIGDSVRFWGDVHGMSEVEEYDEYKAQKQARPK
jgi:hypothetical protein